MFLTVSSRGAPVAGGASWWLFPWFLLPPFSRRGFHFFSFCLDHPIRDKCEVWSVGWWEAVARWAMASTGTSCQHGWVLKFQLLNFIYIHTYVDNPEEGLSTDIILWGPSHWIELDIQSIVSPHRISEFDSVWEFWVTSHLLFSEPKYEESKSEEANTFSAIDCNQSTVVLVFALICNTVCTSKPLLRIWRIQNETTWFQDKKS